jgi:D-alanyl-D-alanine carboxypeptidase (penicillin-binding protein 5/6)
MMTQLFTLIFFISSLSIAEHSLSNNEATLQLNSDAEQAIITDYYTGKVLFEKNADQPMHPSSMTKIMTAYMAFEKLKKGIVKPETTVRVSTKAWKMGGSRMFIDVDKDVSIDELLKGVIVVSGNDASVALAEALAGSEEVFAQQMTQKAREMGCTNTTFRNASGWPDPQHLTTARDLSIILKHVIQDFPEYHGLFAMPEFRYNNITQYNRHPLFDKNIGCDVGKTGFTDSGQYGLVASAKEIDHNGRQKRVNMVINGLPSAKARAATSMSHLTWALKNFSTIPIAQKKEALATIKIKDGIEKTVTLTPIEDIFATIPQTASSNIKTELVLNPVAQAPIKIGQVLGKAVISVPSYDKALEVDLVATKDIPRAGIIKRIINAMAQVFQREA